MRLIPSPAFFPLRFHTIRSLLRISRATGTFIPLAPALLEVLNSADMKNPPKPSKLHPLDFGLALKAPKAYLRTRVYQDGVGEQVVELFSEFFVLWCKSIAFPEFSLPVVIMVKRWLKTARKKGTGINNMKVVSGLVVLMQKTEANATFIEEKRAKVDFAPNDRAQVDAFLKDFEWEKTPLGAYVAAQRKLRAQKAKEVEKARREDDRKRKELEEQALEDQVEDDFEGFGDEEDDESGGEVIGENDEDEDSDGPHFDDEESE